MQKLRMLIVEDGKPQRDLLTSFLKKEGHLVSEAETGEQALLSVGENHFDLLLLDYRMPGMNGMEVLKQVKRLNPEIDVVIITAFGTVETAVEAMKEGALDYITKPIDFDDLLFLLARVAERRTLIREKELLQRELQGKEAAIGNMASQSRKMQEVISLGSRVAGSRTTVLILGESGTGKELLARLIHSLSPRAKKPLITVNCGTLHENLLESELFGHEKGAFTGAAARRIGRVEEADGGTLFLDEIGDISLSLQVKLLRFLQEREFQRLGGNQVLSADVRILAATNRDLEAGIKEGLFREDLFYRLNVISLSLPPLRERKEDLPGLIDHFLARFSRENGRKINGITSEARDLLMKYDYPGNVRELENIIERAVVISREEVITTADLPFQPGPPGRTQEKREEGGLKNSVEDLERRLIADALAKADHHQTKAAEILGISERMLRYKIKKYELKLGGQT